MTPSGQASATVDALPRGEGTVILPGGGAWLRKDKSALVLASPLRILSTSRADQVPELLDEVEEEQKKWRYVAGFLAYEAGEAFGLKVRGWQGAPPPFKAAAPLAWFAVYDPASVNFISHSSWKELLASSDPATVLPSLEDVNLRFNVTRKEYDTAIARVREYIAAGDTYQVNYTVRGRFTLNAPQTNSGNASLLKHHDSLAYFLALLVRQPVPYAAYLDLGEIQVISLSPEMFLRREGSLLESRPMKGTRPRGASHAEDVALAYELAQLEKERAENLMIVDMVRNDLGRVCRAGSVRVPALYVLEPYRTLWQMVSIVAGEVNSGARLRDIMAAVFPGASITGAPKYHTMELIAELENEPRGVYTGAIGLFQPGGDFTLNIAIRTIVYHKGNCVLGVGSGVVWDAMAAAEYEETRTKASFAFLPQHKEQRADLNNRHSPCQSNHHSPRQSAEQSARASKQDAPDLLSAEHAARKLAAHEPFYLFETTLLQPAGPLEPADKTALGRYLFLDDHLQRLAASAQAFGFPFDQKQALLLLAGHADQQRQSEIVRLVLSEDGSLELASRPLPSPAQTVALLVSPVRTDPDDPYLRHKTSQRGIYNREHRRALERGCFDALFLNRLDRVTEGAITNIFARFGERWVTPPVDDGLLPGIWRAHFLKHTGAAEDSLLLSDLQRADEVVVGNSVRGAVRVNRLVVDPITV